eukprot:gene45783-1517_t
MVKIIEGVGLLYGLTTSSASTAPAAAEGTVGVGVGPLLHGNVGTARQRFHTEVGAAHCLRPVDVWRIPSPPHPSSVPA